MKTVTWRDEALMRTFLAGSTFQTATEWISFTEAKLAHRVNRSAFIAEQNRRRAEVERQALDAVVRQALGAAPPGAHGITTVVGKRINSLIAKGQASSTVSSSDDPLSPRVIRRSLDRIEIQMSAPVLARTHGLDESGQSATSRSA